ncbi:MAG: superinfection immunity protein [Candidatus Gastranaerophilales bacterium]|nr:superinfection immunity protein [Candidatus Gastranaerophilales bacterium]
MSIAIANAILLLTLFFLISWLFVACVIYFIPVIVANIRRHNNFGAIVVLNVVLGWTFFGWLAALLWSLNGDVEKEESDN